MCSAHDEAIKLFRRFTALVTHYFPAAPTTRCVAFGGTPWPRDSAAPNAPHSTQVAILESRPRVPVTPTDEAWASSILVNDGAPTMTCADPLRVRWDAEELVRAAEYDAMGDDEKKKFHRRQREKLRNVRRRVQAAQNFGKGRWPESKPRVVGGDADDRTPADAPLTADEYKEIAERYQG